jgi:hypothetical protein
MFDQHAKEFGLTGFNEIISREATSSHAILDRIHSAEKHMTNCFHCGTVLKPWQPACGTEGISVQTDFKWCPSCCCTVFSQLAALIGISQEDSEKFIADHFVVIPVR